MVDMALLMGCFCITGPSTRLHSSILRVCVAMVTEDCVATCKCHEYLQAIGLSSPKTPTVCHLASEIAAYANLNPLFGELVIDLDSKTQLYNRKYNGLSRDTVPALRSQFCDRVSTPR